MCIFNATSIQLGRSGAARDRVEGWQSRSADRNRIVMKSCLDALYAFFAFVKSITCLFSLLFQSSNPTLTAKSWFFYDLRVSFSLAYLAKLLKLDSRAVWVLGATHCTMWR
jgi:hypothetical protein